jgi:hypothetical protein
MRESMAMSDDPPKRKSQADAEFEREILEGRKFSLAEAIGRLAGPGMMKGQSPMTQKQQAEAQLEAYLNQHFRDGTGVLSAVLLRGVTESDLLVANLDQPIVVLACYVQRVLDSDYRLQELVRESDAEWGRVFGERPHFEKKDATPHPDDPYTMESVRVTLSRLIQKLNEGDY